MLHYITYPVVWLTASPLALMCVFWTLATTSLVAAMIKQHNDRSSRDERPFRMLCWAAPIIAASFSAIVMLAEF